MSRWIRDVRLALRALRPTPMFSVSVMVILDIGMATAMSTVADAVLRRPIPVRAIDRLVAPRTFDRTGTELAAAGGALGLACAAVLLRVLLALAPAQLPRMDVIALAGAPVATAAGVTLVVLQVALALVMLASAGLLVRSLRRLETQPLGFVSSRLSIVTLAIPVPSGGEIAHTSSGSPTRFVSVAEQLAPRWRAVDGVRALTPVVIPPFQGISVFIAKLAPSDDPSPAEHAVQVPFEMGGPGLRRALHEVAPDATIWRARTMDDYLDAPLAQPRLGGLLLSGFGIVALTLAAIGRYGVMAAMVRERTREIGERMALGATPSRLRRDVLGRAFVIVAAGLAAGVVVVVALVAAYVPARAATRVDPARTLRAD